jgi:hypothetical protein
MSKTNAMGVHRSLVAAAMGVCLLMLMACSIDVKKDRDGDEKNVDIRTPVGRIHVSKDAEAGDTGLAVYPGARLRDKDSNEHHDENANVNLSFGDYGLKVVAVHYESDDPSEKVISFYKEQLKVYGGVLECHTSQSDGNAGARSGKDSDSDELGCEDSGGNVLELKAGTKHNQRIVTIEPKGTITRFALVRVQTHGHDPI